MWGALAHSTPIIQRAVLTGQTWFSRLGADRWRWRCWKQVYGCMISLTCFFSGVLRQVAHRTTPHAVSLIFHVPLVVHAAAPNPLRFYVLRLLSLNSCYSDLRLQGGVQRRRKKPQEDSSRGKTPGCSGMFCSNSERPGWAMTGCSLRSSPRCSREKN